MVVQALRLGVRDYLTKPFAMDELLAAVGRALEERRLRPYQWMTTEVPMGVQL